MDEEIDATFRTHLGKICALTIAVSNLIDMTPSPDATRSVIGLQIQHVMSLIGAAGDVRHAQMVDGMREQKNEMLGTD